MRKFISMFLSLAILFSFVTAAPSAVAYEENVQTASSSDTYYAVIDSDGNIYSVSGRTYLADTNKCSTSTSYSTHYSDGEYHPYERAISISTSVLMLNGLLPATNSYTGSATSRTTSFTYTRTSKAYLYSIYSASSIHDFTCNGKGGTGSSSFSLLTLG